LVNTFIGSYLTAEAKNKKIEIGPFTEETIPTLVPAVAKQPNFSDCGVYLLKYAEYLLNSPPGTLPSDATEAAKIVRIL